ncbi:MAG: MalY/PatB family protein [Sporolactobacillus sp.]
MEKSVFEQFIERHGTASEKWDGVDERFGGQHLLPLWVADMDFRVPDGVTKALEARVRHGVYGYTFRSPSYLAAVCEWMSRRHGWSVEPEWICHSPGVVTALNLIVDGFTTRGDKVLIQPPVYPPFRKAVANQHRELVTSPLIPSAGNYTMNFDDLAVKMADPAVKLMILCSPHNPVGRVWTAAELTHLAQLALANDVLIVSDEIHGDLVFSGQHHLPFAKISNEMAQHSIICTAPSKTFNLAGLQISNVIIPNPSLRETYTAQLARFSLGEPNALGIVAAEAAYRSGDAWLDECLQVIERHARTLVNFFANELSALSMCVPEGTYLGWIDCRALGLNERALQKLFVEKAHLALNPGASFGEGGDGFVRINLACPEQILHEAMRRLRTAVGSLS